MEEPRRARGDEEKKKMFVKVGGVGVGSGGGGGIGAVVMLGGVLATAALASTFIVRKKGRSSGEESRGRKQGSEIKKQSVKEEEEEAGVYKQPSSEAKKETESDNNLGALVSSQRFKMDEKPGIEVHDFQPRNELKNHENHAVSDIKEDENPSFEPRSTVQNEGEAKIEQTKENIVWDGNSGNRENVKESAMEPRDDGGKERTTMNYKEAVVRNCAATKADLAVEGVHNDQKEEQGKEIEGVSCNNGKISEEKHGEAAIEQPDAESCIEDGQKTHLPVSARDHVADQENEKEGEIVSESHCEKGQQGDHPGSDNPVVEHNNAKGNETIPEKNHSENELKAEMPVADNPVMEYENEEGTEMIPEKSYSKNGENDPLPLSDSPVMENNKPAEIFDIVGENEEAIAKTEQNEAKCDQTGEGTMFVPVKHEEEPNHSDLQHDENGQETSNSKPEDGRVGVVTPEQDLSPVENTKAETDNSSEITNEVRALFHKFDDSIATAKDAMMMELGEDNDDDENTENFKDSNDDQSDSSDGAEKSSDSSVESNSDAVWPAETIIESRLSEMTGKTKEDVVSVKKPEKINEKNYINMADTEKTFVKHLMGMAMLREMATNLTRRRMIIGTGFALSTLSCSWFFGLTLLKLCLIVFMTMALSKINTY